MTGDERWPGSWSGTVRGRLRRIAVAGVITVSAVGTVVGLIGLGLGQPETGRVVPVTPTAGAAPPLETSGARQAGACTSASAARLARLVLTWDSGRTLRLAAVRRVVATADVDGEEGSGLVQDLDGYLPVEAVWQQLAVYGTRQRATIGSVRTPRSWPSIVAANQDRLGSRTAAFTVHAVRYRVGKVDGVPDAASDAVSFTLFVTCPEGATRFRLTRLSRLDHPLP